MKILTPVLVQGEPIKDAVTEQVVELLRYAADNGNDKPVQARDYADMLERGELAILQAPANAKGQLAWFSPEEWETFRNIADSLAMTDAETTHAASVLDCLTGLAWEGQDDE